MSSADTVREGAAVYAKVCAACHGSAGEGLSGPPLVGIGKRKSVEEIEAWVINPVSAGKPQGAAVDSLPTEGRCA